jgi:hypothetical protein
LIIKQCQQGQKKWFCKAHPDLLMCVLEKKMSKTDGPEKICGVFHLSTQFSILNIKNLTDIQKVKLF